MTSFAAAGLNIGPTRAAYAAPATISGKADIIITNKQAAYYQGAVAQCKATIHLPDGSTQITYGHCISGLNYAVPYDGTYDYVGTRRSDGRYSVVIRSDVSAGANAGVFLPGKLWGTQQMGGINIAYSPKVTVRFTKRSADISITEGNAEYRLDGAVYDIHEQATGNKVASITTDPQGHAHCELKPNTAYYAIEVKAPAGFTVNESRVEFTTSEDTLDVELDDRPGSVKLTVKKKDSATLGAPQAGASLAGATFSATSLSTPGWQAEGTTDEQGNLVFDSIPLGKVSIVETSAPLGYKLDPNPHVYTVLADQLPSTGVILLEPDDFAEHIKAFDIDIVKYCNANTGESGLQEGAEGIQFHIIANSTGKTVGTLTTDEDGRASTSRPETVNEEACSSDKTYDPAKPWMGLGKRNEHISGALPFDVEGYTVREVAETTPGGYQPCPDWTIDAESIVDGTSLHYIVNNDLLSSRIQIVKVDAQSGQTVPVSGFTFQLLDEHKQPITQEIWHPNHEEVSEFTTDDTGCVTLPEELHSGTYYIREVAAVAPYLLLNDDLRVEIPHEGAVEPMTIVRVENNQAHGVARIHKTCLDPSSCAASHGDDATTGHPEEHHEAQQDSRADQGLAGAEFDVVALEAIVSPDGTVQAAEGQVLDHITTGSDGWGHTKQLPLGCGTARYAFIETLAPAGHVLDPEPRAFTLTYADSSTDVVYTDVEMANKPSELRVDKSILGKDRPLGGAEFALWRVEDEISVGPRDSGSLAIRADESVDLSARRTVPYAVLESDLPDGIAVELIDSDGKRLALESESTPISAGSYEVAISHNGEMETVPDLDINLLPDHRYRLTVSEGILRPSVSCEDIGLACEPVALSYSAQDCAHVATELPAGDYTITADDSDVKTITLGDNASYFELDGTSLIARGILLQEGSQTIDGITKDDGTFAVKHLGEGTYRLRETRAPKGFLPSPDIYDLTVSPNGLIEGDAPHHIAIADDYTKVDISKRDITNEKEIPGAKLAILDEDGTVIERWVSTTAPHRIERLEPGIYTLVEEMTPNTYDQAQSVTFTVEADGHAQAVVMYDEPIEVSGEVDKRQEIAKPIAPGVLEDGDGRNNAPAVDSQDGTYRYSIDFRNTSNTWVDEFTVTDDLDAAKQGVAHLTGITTPVSAVDFDGKMNVWYTTNKTDAGHVDPNDANATLDDGHKNPWLNEDANPNIGESGRRVSYAGWRLWKRDVPTTKAQELSVEELELGESEYVTGIRLEYGRVERDFTSRLSDWDRKGLKDPHDDQDRLDYPHRGNKLEVDEERLLLSPAIVHMKVTDRYIEGAKLENTARVDLYRNGGGEHLEDHDEDHVEQTARRVPGVPLAQTGALPLSTFMISTAICTGLLGVTVHGLRRLRLNRSQRSSRR